jgi:hypothetical protein
MLQRSKEKLRKEERRRVHNVMTSPITFDLYDVTENPKTIEDKFGGFKVLPRYIETNTTRAKLYPIEIHLKYDNNKLLDHIVSNNGITR